MSLMLVSSSQLRTGHSTVFHRLARANKCQLPDEESYLTEWAVEGREGWCGRVLDAVSQRRPGVRKNTEQEAYIGKGCSVRGLFGEHLVP